MDNLVDEGKEICEIIIQLLHKSKKFEILKTMLYCKYCLNFNKDDINNNTFNNFYERCKKYLEESEKYIDSEYIKKIFLNKIFI